MSIIVINGDKPSEKFNLEITIRTLCFAKDFLTEEDAKTMTINANQIKNRVEAEINAVMDEIKSSEYPTEISIILEPKD